MNKNKCKKRVDKIMKMKKMKNKIIRATRALSQVKKNSENNYLMK